MSRDTAPGDVRLVGNRIWLARTADGTVIQKLYAPHDHGPRYWARLLLERLGARKTPTTVRARWRTERELLRVWRAAGCDVPQDLSERHPALVHGPVTILERVEGPLLGHVLGSGRLSEQERVDLLTRFAAAWGRRHRLAIEQRDARLVQEHGTFLHVIMAPGRLVTIDLEQAYHPRRDVRPLVTREIVAYVRSLAKRVDEARLAADLRILVAAYPDRSLLEAAVREYVDSPRLVWRLDRRLRRDRGRALGKYGALALLRAALLAVAEHVP